MTIQSDNDMAPIMLQANNWINAAFTQYIRVIWLKVPDILFI